MPFYDFKCPSGCGYFGDIFVPLSEHGTTTCTECGDVLETVISEVALIGPMPSKPLVMKQLGRTFESGSEWRQYQRDNPLLGETTRSRFETRRRRGQSARATETLKIRRSAAGKKR